jgi:hypothetical protein
MYTGTVHGRMTVPYMIVRLEARHGSLGTVSDARPVTITLSTPPPSLLVPASARPSDTRIPPPPIPGEWDRDVSAPVSASDNKASEG